MSDATNFALVPRPSSTLEKAEPGAKRILSGMVVDTIALARKEHRTKLNIVVVDDDPETLEMWRDLIRGQFKESRILLFQDGQAAWEELSRPDPDLLITDIGRPKLCARDMLPLLAEKRVKYPILVVSGITDEDVIRRLRECAGPHLNVSFLRKNAFVVDEFLEAIRVALEPLEDPSDKPIVSTNKTSLQPPPRIVILDDEEGARESYSIMLKNWYHGVEILTFDDAREAWHNLSHTDPNLFITDINHQWISCKEMLERLAERRVEYPILVISAYGSASYGEVVRTWRPGLSVSLLNKPVRAEKFRMAVESALRIPARPLP